MKNITLRCAVKVDLMKAFAPVHWGFLLAVMDKMKFPMKFINWIRTCMESAHFSITVQGSLFGYFKAKKGARQDDLLSPYLFTLAMEVLSSMLDMASLNRSIPFHP
ncbi:unnamed protein product [Linum trigynum]|uniref:Reverse transcriptase domain-containing protein n=1 Tax=Linum trigynum TaxID=586398 RepID=A0AAV2EDP2_9ROSI